MIISVNLIIYNFNLSPLGLDDKMADGRSDANGEFNLDGTESEVSSIEPRLQV